MSTGRTTTRTTAAPQTTPGEDRFWMLAAPLLERDDITQGTIMGFPCLRVGGEYFASAEHRTGDLVVKLPEARVDELVEAGKAEPFTPNGRRFREWALVPFARSRSWKGLMAEALAFVEALPAKPERGRR